jgi:hypothetical protein
MKALTGIKLPCFDRQYLESNDTLQVSAVSAGMPKLSSASRSKMIGFSGSKFFSGKNS